MRKKLIGTPDGSTTLLHELSRRGFLGNALLGAAGLGAAGLGAGSAIAAAAAPGGAAKGAGVDVHNDGSYTTVPLVKDSIRIGIMQTRIRPITDPNNAGPMKKENLDHMLMLIENAQEWNPPSDILFFHEFPITGFNYGWTRKEINSLSIETPGPETEALGAKAKQYGCYIVFGSYVNDRDWPGHVISQTTIIGPDGTVIDKHWKARSVMGAFVTGNTPIELMTSTVYNCLDRYIEMYGIDAVIPVTRTPIGNLCTSSVQKEPELFRAMAVKGGEIFLRTASGGFTAWDIQASAGHNQVYAAVCNNAVSPGNLFFEDAGAGGSAIYAPSGTAIAMAASGNEQLVSGSVPIREFRARHRVPEFAWPLYEPVFGKYRPRFPASKFTKQLPADLKESARYLRDKANMNW